MGLNVCFYFVGGLVLGGGDVRWGELPAEWEGDYNQLCVCVCVRPSGFVCFCFLISSSRKQPDEKLQSGEFQQERELIRRDVRETSPHLPVHTQALLCQEEAGCNGVQPLCCRFIQSLNRKETQLVSVCVSVCGSVFTEVQQPEKRNEARSCCLFCCLSNTKKQTRVSASHSDLYSLTSFLCDFFLLCCVYFMSRCVCDISFIVKLVWKHHSH